MLAALQFAVPWLFFLSFYKGIRDYTTFSRHGKFSCLHILSRLKMHLAKSGLATSNTKCPAVLAGHNWSSMELCRCPGLFFNWTCLDCEISGQEPPSVLLNHHKNCTFFIFEDDSEGGWFCEREEAWDFCFFICNKARKKKDPMHWELERKLSLFFTSNVRNNNFSAFTVGFDRWLPCDCKPSCSLTKQYSSKTFRISELEKMLKFC